MLNISAIELNFKNKYREKPLDINQHRRDEKLGPRLLTDTQHSTLNVFEWGNPECRVLRIHHKFWGQHSQLKPPASALCI